MRKKLLTSPLPEGFHYCSMCFGIFESSKFYVMYNGERLNRCAQCQSDHALIYKAATGRRKDGNIRMGFIAHVKYHNLRILRKLIRKELDPSQIVAWVPQTKFIYKCEITINEFLTVALYSPTTGKLTYSVSMFIDDPNMNDMLESLLENLRPLRLRFEENEAEYLNTLSNYYIYGIDFTSGKWFEEVSEEEKTIKEYAFYGRYKKQSKVEIGEF